MKGIYIALFVLAISVPSIINTILENNNERENRLQSFNLRSDVIPCQNSTDLAPCGEAGYWKCTNNNITGAPYICVHKHYFSPLYGEEVGGMISVFLLILFANMSGVAGGGLIIPLIILFNNFDAKTVAT